MVTDVYSHILDEDRKKNAELFEQAFYENRELQEKSASADTAGNADAANESGVTTVADLEASGVDMNALGAILSNPEMVAMLAALAKGMKK